MMRKIYLLVFIIGCGVIVMVQMLLVKCQNDILIVKVYFKLQLLEKVILWSNDFFMFFDWVILNVGLGGILLYIFGDWVIIINLVVIFVFFLVLVGFVIVFNGYVLVNFDVVGFIVMQNMCIVIVNVIDFFVEGYVIFCFFQIFCKFQEMYNVIVSNDNGVIWIIFVVNLSVSVNMNFVNLEECVVNISFVVGNQLQVKIGFQYIGVWDFFWVVDDVYID